MTRRYRLIVFDWEGTLTDSLGHVLHVLQEEAQKMGLSDVDEQMARSYMALGLVVALKKLFPELDSDKSEILLTKMQEALALRPTKVYLYPGAKELVKKIYAAGIDLAIATNKGQPSLQRALNICGLDKYFSVTRSAGQVPAKPCPQMLDEIIDYCGVSLQETLMIGDSISDMEMANAVGVDAIGVHFYFQEEQKQNMLKAGAIDVFDNYQTVSEFLNL